MEKQYPCAWLYEHDGYTDSYSGIVITTQARRWVDDRQMNTERKAKYPEVANLRETPLGKMDSTLTLEATQAIRGAHPGLPYGIIDPDYARIYTQARIVAWSYGYALMMHGSFTRDLDLVMVPWEKQATAKMVGHVVKYMAQVCGLTINGEPGKKPHGRLAYTLLFPAFGDPRWIDLSVWVPPKEEMDSAT